LYYFGVAITIAGCVLLAVLAASRKRQALGATDQRRRVEAIPLTAGAEIQSSFAVSTTGGQAAMQPMCPGLLTRLQGRVVAKPGGALVAPFSGKTCVIYSASVSDHREDGVHQPPVAFHTGGADFTIELEDGSQVSVAVQSQDVSLFDMQDGRYASEQAFTHAPNLWRGFVLAHLVPGANVSSRTMGQVDLGSRGLLNFCECALLVGSTVTCVGEVARDRHGELSLCPWRPHAATAAPLPQPRRSRLGFLPRALPWLATSWERGGRSKAPKDGVRSDPLVGHVLISDDGALLYDWLQGAFQT
jgi:hypothetical protein